MFLDLALHRAPAVRSSVTVSADMRIDVFIEETRNENLPSMNVPSQLQDLRQLNEVLQSVEQLHISCSVDGNRKAHRLLEIVLMLLQDVCNEYQLQEFHEWHLEVLKLESSQVELILKNTLQKCSFFCRTTVYYITACLQVYSKLHESEIAPPCYHKVPLFFI